MTPEEQAALDTEARVVEGEFIAAGEAAAAPGAEPEKPEVTTGQLLTSLLVPTFGILAPNWRVTNEECALLGESYGAVVDKYLPDLDLGVELAAALATFAVFGPRWGKPAKVVEPAKQDEKKDAPAG